MAELICVAHVPTPAINLGFLPAARRLGLNVTLLTDKPEENSAEFRRLGIEAPRLLECDVFNPIAIVDAVLNHGLGHDAIFSNSDHLQTATAMAAQFLGAPHKSVRACYLAKHKAQMRRAIEELGIETVWHQTFNDAKEVAAARELRFPCVAKPCKGVASQQVKYIETREQLVEFASTFWDKTAPGQRTVPMLVEEYLAGTIYSLESLGDGQRCHYLGGFTCTLCELPYFIEIGARWGLETAGQASIDHVMHVLDRLGCTFGACHTEFVLSEGGPKIIEINYRSIGDQSDFMLDNLMGGHYFEQVLRAQLGETLQIEPVDPDHYSVAEYLFSEKAGVIAGIPKASVTTLEGCAVHVLPVKEPGDELTLSNSNKDYLALIHVTGRGRERVERLVQQQARSVQEAIQWR
jgi:biotin carboxylase